MFHQASSEPYSLSKEVCNHLKMHGAGSQWCMYVGPPFQALKVLLGFDA